MLWNELQCQEIQPISMETHVFLNISFPTAASMLPCRVELKVIRSWWEWQRAQVWKKHFRTAQEALEAERASLTAQTLQPVHSCRHTMRHIWFVMFSDVQNKLASYCVWKVTHYEEQEKEWWQKNVNKSAWKRNPLFLSQDRFTGQIGALEFSISFQQLYFLCGMAGYLCINTV